MTSFEKLLDSTLDSAQLVIFSKTYCGYSRAAKKHAFAMAEKHPSVTMRIIELDTSDDRNPFVGPGQDIRAVASRVQSALFHTKDGVQTVPQVFINGTFFGDSSVFTSVDIDTIAAQALSEKNKKEAKEEKDDDLTIPAPVMSIIEKIRPKAVFKSTGSSGEAIFYFQAPCCGEISRVHSADGKLLCAPGDGRCPAFDTNSPGTLVYKDDGA